MHINIVIKTKLLPEIYNLSNFDDDLRLVVYCKTNIDH